MLLLQELHFSMVFLSVDLGHKAQRICFLGCCVISVSRPGRRVGSSISCGLNHFRFWTDSTIISMANLYRNKRPRSGLPLSKSGFTEKTRRQRCTLQCPEDSGRLSSANDGIYVGLATLSKALAFGSVLVRDYFRLFIFAFIM